MIEKVFVPDICSVFGKYLIKESGNIVTTHQGRPTPEDFKSHVDGVEGLGMCPISRYNTCLFGAVDIDNHGANGKETIDIADLAAIIERKKLPLIPCQSKSGGVHAYLFLKRPTRAAVVKRFLITMAKELGFPRAEVFPKQTSLSEDGKGNWINLPYFGGTRQAYAGGRLLSLEEFLALVQERITELDEQILPAEVMAQAPPCMLQVFADGAQMGMRNETMFNVAVFLRAAGGKEWRQRAHEANQELCDTPLTKREMDSIVGSVARNSSFNYRCSELPLVHLCDAKVCSNRKFGSKAIAQGGVMDENNYSKLVKLNTDPVVWLLYINDRPVRLTSAELLCPASVATAALEQLGLCLPVMQKKAWVTHMKPYIDKHSVIDAPQETRTPQLLLTRLKEFLRRIDIPQDATSENNVGRLGDLAFGRPVVQVDDGDLFVYFRGSDFIDYLKRIRAEETRPHTVWSHLSKVGVTTTLVSVDGQELEVWKVRSPQQPVYADKEIRSEF